MFIWNKHIFSVQEKQELLEKLKETESLKEKYNKREEEKEEMQQFTTQEMGKLKHMVCGDAYSSISLGY